jgi:Fe-S cluster assembly protein SufB
MREIKTSRSYQEQAGAAEEKVAAAGKDVNIKSFDGAAEEHPYQADPSQLPRDTKAVMLQSGVMTDSPEQRSGTYIQMDNKPVHYSSSQEGIELMPISEALEKYDWLPDYWWRAVAVDADKYTAAVELGQADGYFIRALPGVKTSLPVQTCLYLAKANLAQKSHNIIIAEEGSELHIITGCATGLNEEGGLHLGVSEFYVKRGARITFTMIHTWNPNIAIRPRSGTIIEEKGIFLNNYILMKPVNSLQMAPKTRCVGRGAVTRQNSVLVSAKGSSLDVGSTVILDAPGSRAEIVSRAITTGGEITARGLIEGNAPNIKGHLECRGLILGNGGVIHAIPELKGTLAGIDLSHEAAVGKIDREEIAYLMARGLTENEATAAIVRGFLRVDIAGLPPTLAAEVEKAIADNEQDVL